MPRPSRLPDDDVSAFLATSEGWALDGHVLEKTFSFASYSAGAAFVLRAALFAERHDHHPDLLLAYGRVAARLTTHDAGGVTALDVAMARFLDALPLG